MTDASTREATDESTMRGFPLRWKIHRLVDVYFTADAEAVQHHLPSQLRPFRWSPNRTVVSLIAGDWEWWTESTPICRSGTVMASAQVARGPRSTPLAMLRGMKVGGPSDRFVGGSFPLQVATTSRMALELWGEAFGVPGCVADLRYELRPTFDRFTCRQTDGELLDMTVSTMGRARSFTSAKERGFCIQDGALTGYWGEADGASRSRFGFSAATLDLGDQPFALVLQELGLSSRPFAAAIWLEGEQRMTPAKRDFGSATRPTPMELGPAVGEGRLTISRAPNEKIQIDQHVTAHGTP